MKMEQLSRLRLFKKVELKSLQNLLRECQFAELAVGDTLIEAGRRNDRLYLLLNGRLQVYLDSSKATPVATIEPGESVGEISVMDQLPASATVVASEVSRLLVIPREIFWRLIAASHGIAANLLSMLAQRLRDNNSTIFYGKQQVQMLSSAIEQTADTVMITDRNGAIEYVNPAFEHTTGYSRSAVYGKTPRLLKSDKHDEAFAQRLWETILSGHVFRDVFVNCKKNGQIFYEDKTITPLTDDSGEITHFIATGKDITEQMAAQERLRYLAQHDPLTDVPNRNLLMDRLNQALAHARGSDRAAAVLFLDLDRFKLINDTLGHDAGDQVLLAISQRLRKCVRKSDTVARLGGDEFALVLTNINQPQDITAIARGILEIFTHPIELKDREVFITASMGISVYPYNSEDAASLLQQAHIAACQAKENGRNNFQFFSLNTQANRRSVDRLNMETDLRRALERGEFLLHYQPQVDLDGHIIGLEALIRWKHPEHGLVAPVEFISLLEETGLIIPVGEWVLRTACQQAKVWSAGGIRLPYLSVNLSARQLDDKGLLAIIDNLRSDMPSMFLELEITESVVMRHGDVPVETLRALHAMGVRLTIDDFGTGYSSLAYLKRFPIQTLKIDRSFIKDLTVDADDDAIVSAVIALARGLGLNVVAEGVETPEQLRFLRSKHCYSVQGYLFSKPLPVDEITGMLRAGKPLTPVVQKMTKNHPSVSRRVRPARPRQGAA